MSGAQRLRLALAAGLLALSVGWPLYYYASRLWRLPSEQQWRQVAASVRAGYASGDVLLADPWYLRTPYTLLGDLPYLTLRALHPDDLLGWRRVHLLRLAGAPGEALGQALTASQRLLSAQRYGPLVHELYEVQPPSRVLYDFVEQVRAAAVRVRYDDAASDLPCDRWQQERWLCPRHPDWNFVKREWLDYDDVPRALLWAHPPDRNGLLALRWADVPLGERLVGSHAFTRWAATRAAAPVELTVLVDGQVRLRQVVPVGKGLWRFSIDTRDAGPSAAVELRVRAAANGAAHYGVGLLSVSGGAR